MDSIAQDLRYAIRSLRRSRGFAITAVLSIAAGLGLLRSRLYGVSPTDPLTFAVVVAVMSAVAALACFVPARRAARIDPVVALASE